MFDLIRENRDFVKLTCKWYRKKKDSTPMCWARETILGVRVGGSDKGIRVLLEKNHKEEVLYNICR